MERFRVAKTTEPMVVIPDVALLAESGPNPYEVPGCQGINDS
jgi:hypothetical protein